MAKEFPLLGAGEGFGGRSQSPACLPSECADPIRCRSADFRRKPLRAIRPATA